MKRFLRSLAIGVGAVALVASLVAPAFAATRKSTIVKGSGSDTTYNLMVALDALYNGSPGCRQESVPPEVQKLNFACYDAGSAVQTENLYHDVATEYHPLGSSNGVTQLCKQGDTNVATIDFARSSRAPRTGDCAGSRFVSYARDALSWWSHDSNTHAPANLTQAQIKAIFVNCTATEWGQVNGNAGDHTPIVVYASQRGSGTRGSWDSFIGGNSENCIANNNFIIFENNAQPILDAGDEGEAIFSYSFGRINQSGGEGGSLGKIDGVTADDSTIIDGTFPYSRNVYNVYRATTSTRKANAATKSYISEKTGWLCKTAAAHGDNPKTGHNFRADIASTISAQGFVPWPSGAIGGGVTGTSHCRVTPLV